MKDGARKVSDSTSQAARVPAHEQVYQKLREQILFGEIAPGEAVTIQGLTERLDAGMTPVREAIRRLTSEGALQFQGNRRVIVPHLTDANISEIIFARQWLESHLALRATERATPADHQQLTVMDDAVDHAIQQGDLRNYLEMNYRFHAKIYDLAGAPILSEIADSLWLRFGPSLRVMIGRVGTQNQPDKHKAVLECMRTGDAEGAARAIREDMLQGMEQIRRILEISGDNR
ncbi:MAG: GntR family transcriptional regulator [Sediminimonas sp.]|uniref:GntR family transcriptional regulator n=1 Tax=Sediminimonas qiaohouensis TaxID=552061 RepID=A0A7C9HBQ7_9RHOB|nr:MULTISPECIES: GntR family transcriptional regulator [Sediminimonas]MDR9484286.1 GntR family transcriptional regulator [Sediminimonas sp.]MTJ05364.1 GntR family transcriptional regulator [Sediminimonas qiaohouensis]